jgi:hypothetical protein
MANYTKTADGFYQVPIIALGERLRDNFGLTIREHPHFDAVDPVHSKNSYHYANQAIDVQDWRDDVIDGVDWRTRTGNLENLLTGSGVEVFGPNSGVKGHNTHLHLAAKDGLFKLTDDQFNVLFGGGAGGKLATFPGVSQPLETSTSTSSSGSLGSTSDDSSGRIRAHKRAAEYSKMSKAALDAEYDRLRREDPRQASIEGMKMHKSYFGKR